MRAVVQRVKEAGVTVDGKEISKIKEGLMVLLGIEGEDQDKDLDYIYRKVVNLRVFDDENGIMNKSLIDEGKDILLVSQFTLYGDARKGNRPSYVRAAKFNEGINLYQKFIDKAKEDRINIVTGEYGADMDVKLINHGPVTILLDSRKEF
ncbi:D-aminoacyl-tRNA deacylase [Peptoniphilus catoniae]|uniref:D-aminoacyl-tRNA deacylase n=1 Tax=Peptoniphilus catoniae TaxID=1660341 RepID=UPI0010FD0643|nr:D-aminoacyl-tRNA deacylase [Peptoniphilus catoniae]